MAYEWQTVEAAAVTLGVSTRTLARRISEGKIESRLENGRRAAVDADVVLGRKGGGSEKHKQSTDAIHAIPVKSP